MSLPALCIGLAPLAPSRSYQVPRRYRCPCCSGEFGVSCRVASCAGCGLLLCRKECLWHHVCRSPAATAISPPRHGPAAPGTAAVRAASRAPPPLLPDRAAARQGGTLLRVGEHPHPLADWRRLRRAAHGPADPPLRPDFYVRRAHSRPKLWCPWRWTRPLQLRPTGHGIALASVLCSAIHRMRGRHQLFYMEIRCRWVRARWRDTLEACEPQEQVARRRRGPDGTAFALPDSWAVRDGFLRPRRLRQPACLACPAQCNEEYRAENGRFLRCPRQCSRVAGHAAAAASSFQEFDSLHVCGGHAAPVGSLASRNSSHMCQQVLLGDANFLVRAARDRCAEAARLALGFEESYRAEDVLHQLRSVGPMTSPVDRNQLCPSEIAALRFVEA